MSLVAAGLAVALSGCFKLDMQLELQSDDTVDGSVVIAVARDQAALVGGEDALRDALQGGDVGILSDSPDAGDVEQRDYEDADWIGTESVFSDVPIDEFGQGESGDLTITRDGDEFVVEGTLDMSGEQETDASAQAVLDSAELQIAVTFPGAVSEANGQVDGDTVTWVPSPGEVLEISARGSAVAGVNWTFIAAIAALVALLVVGIVLIVVVRRRAPAAPDDEPAGEAAHETVPETALETTQVETQDEMQDEMQDDAPDVAETDDPERPV